MILKPRHPLTFQQPDFFDKRQINILIHTLHLARKNKLKKNDFLVWVYPSDNLKKPGNDGVIL